MSEWALTRFGRVDSARLNIKLLTDWLMEAGAALGRRLCGGNRHSPRNRLGSQRYRTVKLQTCFPRVFHSPSSTPHPSFLVSAFQMIPTAYSYERRLLARVRRRREARGTGAGVEEGGAHPGPRSPGKVTAWIIGTNQVTACIERMSLWARRMERRWPIEVAPKALNSPTMYSVNPASGTVIIQQRSGSLVNMQGRRRRKSKGKKKETGRVGASCRWRETFPIPHEN